MKPEAFLETARTQISANPLDRVSSHIQDLIKDPRTIYDPHCHIFSKNEIPVRFFLLKFLKDLITPRREVGFQSIRMKQDNVFSMDVEGLYQKIENSEIEGFTIDKIESDLESLKVKAENDISRIDIKIDNTLQKLDTLKIDGINENTKTNLDVNLSRLKLRKTEQQKNIGQIEAIIKILKFDSNEEVLKFYLDEFAIKNLTPFENNPFITSVLMMDIEKSWGERPRKNIRDQILELKKIVADIDKTNDKTKSNNPILPFLFLDPRRADDEDEFNLYKLFLDAFPKLIPSFFGVKIYPALGYLPSDDRLLPIFQICQEKKIPVLSHCGGNRVSTFTKNPVEISNKKTDVVMREGFKNSDGSFGFKVRMEKFGSRAEFADFLNQPEHWKPVLEMFPNLKLNIAHFGSEDAWDNSTNDLMKKRKDTIIELMKEFKSVYADFSYNVAIPDTFDNLKKTLDSDEIIRERTMFGTDFWVVFSSIKNPLRVREEAFIEKFNDPQHQKRLFKEVPESYLFDIVPPPPPIIADNENG